MVPERHGAMTGIMKAQIDWIPLSVGAVRPDPGQDPGGDAGERRLAVLQRGEPDAGAGALDAMLTIPNQSSVAKAFLEFDDDDRMKPSAYYDRVVDVMEELVVHAADPRPGPLPGGALQRAQGERGGVVEAGEPGFAVAGGRQTGAAIP